MAARPNIVLQAAAVLVVALLIGLLGWEISRAEKGRGLSAAVAAGKRPLAPAFTLETLEQDGRVSLADYRGKVVVLNFWASWCLPCKDEAPMLEAVWNRYRDRGVVVLGVDANDFRVDARRFVDRYDLTYPVVYDGRGSTLGRYGLSAFPETWFVNRNGRLVEHVDGPVDEESLERGIAKALATA